MFSFQNAWPMQRKAVYHKVLFHIIYSFISLIALDHKLHIFLKLHIIFSILYENLQAVTGGKKCCFTGYCLIRRTLQQVEFSFLKVVQLTLF